MLKLLVLCAAVLVQIALVALLFRKYFDAQAAMKRENGLVWRLAEWASWLLACLTLIPLPMFAPLLLEALLFESTSTKKSRTVLILVGCCSLLVSAVYGWRTRRRV